jgi:hypothetical protein
MAHYYLVTVKYRLGYFVNSNIPRVQVLQCSSILPRTKAHYQKTVYTNGKVLRRREVPERGHRLTKLQKQMYERLERGSRVIHINKDRIDGGSFIWNDTNDQVNYKVFWNLMHNLGVTKATEYFTQPQMA